jgi:hypothetical protein
MDMVEWMDGRRDAQQGGRPARTMHASVQHAVNCMQGRIHQWQAGQGRAASWRARM